MQRLGRVIAVLLLLGIGATLIVELLALVDLFGFEFRPLIQQMGWGGIATTIILNAGLIFIGWYAIALVRGHAVKSKLPVVVIFVAWAVFALWVVQWTFMDDPLTFQLHGSAPAHFIPPLTRAQLADFDSFSLQTRLTDPEARRELRVLYARIVLNGPDFYSEHPLGATIDRYARRYDVDPLVVFFFTYVNSFWGEGTPGPVPFLREMTPEDMRDVVQIHLPAWFVENPLRTRFGEANWLPRLLGKSLAFDVRYTLHKATLDVSSRPYDLNLFSDVYQVLREYPGEFPELTQATEADPLRFALRKSFQALRGTKLMLPPYEHPYETQGYTSADYAKHRRDLKEFTRAAYYLLAVDFDFATRVCALVVRYQRDYYSKALGSDRWSGLPLWQRDAMLGMTRDLYVPNVGHFGPSLYALPELNSTPVDFIAVRAVQESDRLFGGTGKVWRPKDYSLLWGGAGTKLRILSELWKIEYGQPLPGLAPEETLDDAATIDYRDR